jgi:twinkle protein
MLAADFIQFGIKIPANATGNIKAVCPECPPHKKSSSNRDKDLSVNVDEGVWNCHRCGWKGKIPDGKPKKEYVKPQPRLQKVSDKVVKYFEGRGISNNTLLRFNITEADEWMPQTGKESKCICFNYYRGEELVNIKFRTGAKDFKLAKDAELIFYNLNAIECQKTAVIVEGEIDCLTMHESGIYNAVSVPNGASKGNQKLEYLDNCWQYFEGMEKIVICVDGDEAGNSLKEELGRRLGKIRCSVVTYPEGCKDANEVLVKYGKESVKQMIEEAKDWPIEGILSVEDLYEEVRDFYENGYPEGVTAEILGFDNHLSFLPGQLTMITGIPGSGKDEFLNLIMANLSKYKQWHFGICNFEEPASFHVTKLIEKISGKAFAFRKDRDKRVNENEFAYAVVMADKFYHYINIDQINATIHGIIEKAEELVKKFGINGLVINPWNCIDHKIPNGYSETQYISESLTIILNFARRCNVHVFLVAHPTKIQKNKDTGKYDVPTLYHISGSSHFFNKTHNGICVYRDFETNQVDIYVQKVKWSWLGKIGYCSFNYDTETRQYIPL